MRDALRGPAIAAADDRARFDERLGLTVGFGLWISALVVWLGTRSLAIAVAAAAGALAAQCGLLLLLYALALPVGSYMLPIALLVGASGSIAGGRACRAVDLDRPFVARGLLITSACQIAAGLTLLTGHEPIWRTLGLCLACGSALASGLGMFVAPGLCALLRRLERGGRP